MSAQLKIIGHRGAAGLALENTLPSIELARLLGVDAIEFDVRMTKDKVLVLCHDSDLERISKSSSKVSDLTLRELQKIPLNDDHSRVPTLKEAIKMAGNVPIIIELKQNGCGIELLKVIKNFPDHDITVASFKLEELSLIRTLNPEIKLVGLERTKPFDIIQFARTLKLDGIGLNFWLLNPLTYNLIRRSKMSIFVYTLNNRLLGHFVRLLYPEAAICTDHPEWHIKHPWLKLRSSHFLPMQKTPGRKRNSLKKGKQL